MSLVRAMLFWSAFLLGLFRAHTRVDGEWGVLDIIPPVVFVGLGVYQLFRWRRAGLRIPWYVHVLAVLGGLSGIMVATLNADLWTTRPLATASVPLIMVGLVYLGFGVYGMKAMIQRHPDRERDVF